MSDLTRLLDRGYTMIWREGRLEDPLRGLDDDFEWEIDWELEQGAPDRVLEMYDDRDDARRAAGLA